MGTFINEKKFIYLGGEYKIVVIENGQIVECGKHEDLIKIENGKYKNLYDMQFKNQEKTNA